MRKIITIIMLSVLCPFSGQAQTAAHRFGQVLVKGNGIAANVVPNASIKVCVVGTQCATISPVYPTSSLSGALPQPLTADSSGNYNYWTGAGCVDEQISSPGQGAITLNSVCPSSGTSNAGSASTLSGVATATFILGASGQVGSGATAVCATGHICDETSGEILLTTGSGSLSSGLVLTSTLGTTRAKPPSCLVEVTGSSTYLGVTKAETVTNFTVTVGSALTASTPYTVAYICGGK